MRFLQAAAAVLVVAAACLAYYVHTIVSAAVNVLSIVQGAK
ncbi:UNVERIFIED_ORG: hypothetical protein ABID57_001331 [Arthrobacter sp. UYEF1]